MKRKNKAKEAAKKAQRRQAQFDYCHSPEKLAEDRRKREEGEIKQLQKQRQEMLDLGAFPPEFENEFAAACVEMEDWNNAQATVVEIAGRMGYQIPTLILYKPGSYPDDLNKFLDSICEEVAQKSLLGTLRYWRRDNYSNKGYLRPDIDPCCSVVVSNGDTNIIFPMNTNQFIDFYAVSTGIFGFGEEVAEAIEEMFSDVGFVMEDPSESIPKRIQRTATQTREFLLAS